MTSVPGSSSQYSSRSLEDTSALFPTETKAEKLSPRDSAFSSSASPSAPLCEEKPIFPGGKLASRGRAPNPAPGFSGDERGIPRRTRSENSDPRTQ